MLEMLKARKEQLEAQGVKGFTLMEMLIVIAIIAVLIAIAIPVMNAQLESARDATTLANLRSAYAQASIKVLDPNQDVANVDAPSTDSTTGTTTVVVHGVDIESTDTTYGSTSDEASLPFVFAENGKIKAPDGNGKVKVTFTFPKTGDVTAAVAADSTSSTTPTT